MSAIGIHVCEDCGKTYKTIGGYLSCAESHSAAVREGSPMSDPVARAKELDEVTWAKCHDCGRPIFRHYAWSHEGGTPPQDHDAEPAGTFAHPSFDDLMAEVERLRDALAAALELRSYLPDERGEG